MFASYLSTFSRPTATTIFTERERVRVLLPAYFHPSSLIAGGFVASPWKAEDIDVWVMIEGEEFVQHLDGLRKELVTLVNSNPLRYRAVLTAPPGCGIGEPIEAAYALRGFFVVGTLYEVGKRPIQIILTNKHTGDDLIASFDLSCHAIGVDIETDTIYRHPQYQHPSYGTTLLDLTTPLHTLRRYLKLAQRYGWTVNATMLAPLLSCLTESSPADTVSHNNLSQNLPEPHFVESRIGMVA